MRVQSFALPGAALCLFWWIVPVSFQPRAGSISNEECLTLSDTPPRGDAETGIYERCSALVPTDVELKADLGRMYEEAGNATKAEAMYQRVLSADPDYADVRLQLGRLLLRRGASTEAREQARLALRIQPNRQALLDLLRESEETPIRVDR